MKIYKVGVRLFLSTLAIIGILYLGGTSIEKFGRDIQIKNPVDLFAKKLNITLPQNDFTIPGISPSGSEDGALPKIGDTTQEELPKVGQDKEELPTVGVNKEELPKVGVDTTNTKEESPTDTNLEHAPPEDEPTVSKEFEEERRFAEELENNSETVIGAKEEHKGEVVLTRTDSPHFDFTRDVVNRIRVSQSENTEKYERASYEKPVKSYKLDGRKISRKTYALRTSPHYKQGRNNTFEYTCPYTGKVITDRKKLDFDHIIPLSYIHKYGNVNWDKATKNAYAYSQHSGLLVQSSSNRSKGGKSPSEWLPKENVKEYCYTWLLLAKEWDIALRAEDIKVCTDILSGIDVTKLDRMD